MGTRYEQSLKILIESGLNEEKAIHALNRIGIGSKGLSYQDYFDAARTVAAKDQNISIDEIAAIMGTTVRRAKKKEKQFIFLAGEYLWKVAPNGKEIIEHLLSILKKPRADFFKRHWISSLPYPKNNRLTKLRTIFEYLDAGLFSHDLMLDFAEQIRCDGFDGEEEWPIEKHEGSAWHYLDSMNSSIRDHLLKGAVLSADEAAFAHNRYTFEAKVIDFMASGLVQSSWHDDKLTESFRQYMIDFYEKCQYELPEEELRALSQRCYATLIDLKERMARFLCHYKAGGTKVMETLIELGLCDADLLPRYGNPQTSLFTNLKKEGALARLADVFTAGLIDRENMIKMAIAEECSEHVSIERPLDCAALVFRAHYWANYSDWEIQKPLNWPEPLNTPKSEMIKLALELEGEDRTISELLSRTGLHQWALTLYCAEPEFLEKQSPENFKLAALVKEILSEHWKMDDCEIADKLAALMYYR
ncbi:hypothetical protein [Chitinibacter tainanensis]|uniref:hypothetical protein n=1 Tax=Chitinibacter tainanensis TaxID=230667 RepID=UPI00041AE4F9|nr:hypothetical protein [Chitinibacter tainanensis]